MIKINLLLTEELYQKLTKEAETQFRSRQSLVRQLISDMEITKNGTKPK